MTRGEVESLDGGLSFSAALRSEGLTRKEVRPVNVRFEAMVMGDGEGEGDGDGGSLSLFERARAQGGEVLQRRRVAVAAAVMVVMLPLPLPLPFPLLLAVSTLQSTKFLANRSRSTQGRDLERRRACL